MGVRFHTLGLDSYSDQSSSRSIGMTVDSFLLLYLSTAIPVFIILRRAGYSGWWTIGWFIPVLNVACILIFAYRPWPVEKRSAAS
jgi:hypothetical protein